MQWIKELRTIIINNITMNFKQVFKNFSDPIDGVWRGKSNTIDLLDITTKDTIDNEPLPSFELKFTLYKISPTKFKGNGWMKPIQPESSRGDVPEKIELSINGEFSRGSKIITYKSFNQPNGRAFHGTCLLIGDNNSTNTMQGKVIGHRTKTGIISTANMTISKELK